MSIPFFYDETITSGATKLILNEDTGRHVVQVLRMKKGEHVHITNGKGYLFTADIITAEKKRTEVNIISETFTDPSARQHTIAISLVKNATRFEWFLEKAAEVGINCIQPIICKRTEKQHFRKDRMNNILVSAMLQSKQTWLTKLEEPLKFELFVIQPTSKQKFIAHCENMQKSQFNKSAIASQAIMLIGPEGDFTREEIDLAIKHDFMPVALGQTRLRTETAGIVAASLMVHL